MISQLQLLDAIRERFRCQALIRGRTLFAHILKGNRFSKAPEVAKGYYKLKEWEQEA